MELQYLIQGHPSKLKSKDEDLILQDRRRNLRELDLYLRLAEMRIQNQSEAAYLESLSLRLMTGLHPVAKMESDHQKLLSQIYL